MSNIVIFESKKVRREWDKDQEDWLFSVTDICGILTDQPNQEGSRNYWKVLKYRLNKEGSELVTKCNQLKKAIRMVG